MSYITKVAKRDGTDEVVLPYPIKFNKDENGKDIINAFDVVESLVGYINAMEHSLSAVVTLIQKDKIEDAIDGVLAWNEYMKNYKNRVFDESGMDYPINELNEGVINEEDYE